MNSNPSVRDRIAALVDERTARQIINILDEEALPPCRDIDCARRWPHSRLAQHRWRHSPGAPRTLGLLGWRCFNCGQHTWRRIHKPRAAS